MILSLGCLARRSPAGGCSRRYFARSIQNKDGADLHSSTGPATRTTIKGFASLAAALGYMVSQHKQIKRATKPQIPYATLFRIFCGVDKSTTLSLPADDATIALLSRRLAELPQWMPLGDLTGAGLEDQNVIAPWITPGKVVLNIDGELQVLRHATAFRETVPGSDAQFMLVVQVNDRRGGSSAPDSIGLIYREADEAAIVALARRLLAESNPFKDRVVLVNRDLRTVRSRMSDRSWNDVVPHAQARAELDFIAASIRNRDMLRAEGLSMKRGLLLSGPPGDGKSTAIECFVNDIAGEATVIIVEAVDHIRSVYHLAAGAGGGDSRGPRPDDAQPPKLLFLRQGRRHRRIAAGPFGRFRLRRHRHHREDEPDFEPGIEATKSIAVPKPSA